MGAHNNDSYYYDVFAVMMMGLLTIMLLCLYYYCDTTNAFIIHNYLNDGEDLYLNSPAFQMWNNSFHFQHVPFRSWTPDKICSDRDVKVENHFVYVSYASNHARTCRDDLVAQCAHSSCLGVVDGNENNEQLADYMTVLYGHPMQMSAIIDTRLCS